MQVEAAQASEAAKSGKALNSPSVKTAVLPLSGICV